MLKIDGEKAVPYINYPVARRWKSLGLVVLFTSESEGTVISSTNQGSTLTVGRHSKEWVSATDMVWEPVSITIED